MSILDAKETEDNDRPSKNSHAFYFSNPTSWVMEAERCFKTAYNIYGCGDELTYKHAVIFCGYGLENLCKAVVVKNKNVDDCLKYNKDTNKLELVGCLLTHEINQLIIDAGIKKHITPDETVLADDITQIILWGKYPTPKIPSDAEPISTGELKVFANATCLPQHLGFLYSVVAFCKKITDRVIDQFGGCRLVRKSKCQYFELLSFYTIGLRC